MGRQRVFIIGVLVAAAAVAAMLSGCASTDAPTFTATSAQLANAPIAALDFVDPDHGWAVGGAHNEVLLFTTTDGDSWRTRRLPVKGRPTDVAFVDKLHGWVAVDSSPGGGVAETAILRTSDGGRHWLVSRKPGVSTYDGGFSFTGPREGWFVGAREDLRFPVVLRTEDGGASWQEVALTEQLVTLTSVAFQEPPMQGWISGYDNQHVGTPSIAFTTLDGGATWTASDGDAAPQSGLFRLDDGHLWSLGEDGDRPHMLRLDPVSGDWEPVDASGDVPESFAFGSANVGWGIHFDTGEEGAVIGWQVLRTDDGGGTWSDSGVEIPGEPTDIVCPTGGGAVVATDAGSVVTIELSH